jgi:hypothetical protein
MVATMPKMRMPTQMVRVVVAYPARQDCLSTRLTIAAAEQIIAIVVTPLLSRRCGRDDEREDREDQGDEVENGPSKSNGTHGEEMLVARMRKRPPATALFIYTIFMPTRLSL